MQLPATAALPLERRAVDRTDEADRFRQQERDFSRQYCHVYNSRLAALRDRLRRPASRLWGDSVPVLAVQELGEQRGVCVLLGTLFKQQHLKPSILKEISEEHNLEPQPVRERFISDDDELVLEDEVGRIRLEGSVEPQRVVNGVVCAVIGEEVVCGKFRVREMCFADLPVQSVDRPLPTTDTWILLVSGLGLQAGGDLFAAQMLVDLVTGQLGSCELQQTMAAVGQVIVAGNSLSSSSQDKNFLKRAAYLGSDVTDQSVAALRSLDDLLQQLAAGCPVDVMPGEFDPTNHQLPQRPLHDCLLPKATGYKTFHSATNPYQAMIGGRRVVGTSGQNVHELYRYSACDDPLTSLERLLTWGHLCPTAPDTLSCFPYYDTDPFIIDKCPDLLFAGNQSRFATKLYTGAQGQTVRLLCLPEFHRTATCALVNLRTLEVSRVSLTADLSPLDGTSPPPDK